MAQVSICDEQAICKEDGHTKPSIRLTLVGGAEGDCVGPAVGDLVGVGEETTGLLVGDLLGPALAVGHWSIVAAHLKFTLPLPSSVLQQISPGHIPIPSASQHSFEAGPGLQLSHRGPESVFWHVRDGFEPEFETQQTVLLG